MHEKDTTNLKKSVTGYMGVFVGNKGKREML